MREFSLTITFDADTKDCRVTGPITDPELCNLGLELARRVIAQHKERAPIQVVNPQQVKVKLPSFLRPPRVK